MSGKKNIIYIFCDDLGWGDVSCLNPESKIQTPNIDKLAANGMSFTDAHAGSAVCTPSRYTLLTGRYCWRTRLKSGVQSGFGKSLLTPERETVASMLKKAGYHTACLGKWHVGLDWKFKEEFKGQKAKEDTKFGEMTDFSQPVKNGPFDLGFDYFYGIPASLDMTPYLFIENDQPTVIPTDISPQGTTPESRARKGICAEGWKHEDVLPTLRKKACAYIDEKSTSEDPFFLYLPLTGPHTPVVPNKEFIGKSECGIYGDFVIEIDDILRDIVETVEAAGITEKTMIIFSSDNGPETLTNRYRESYGHYSAWKFRGVKRDNWEGGHRVPFIVSAPSFIEPGGVCSNLVELADFMATAADMNNLDISDDAAEDSRSILPYLKGDFQTECREFAIHHSSGGQWAIRKGDWKMLLHSGSAGNRYECPENDDPIQLYNMSTDQFETTNVYQQHPEVVAELKGLCIECIEKGRSTPGKEQSNDPSGEWRQLKELLELNASI